MKILYVVPFTSGFLSLLSFVAAREAVRRHAVQRCFRACHGTYILIPIPKTKKNLLSFSQDLRTERYFEQIFFEIVVCKITVIWKY